MGRRRGRKAKNKKAADPKVLPANMQKDFKHLNSFHKNGNNKKALKTADAILKVCPQHCETLAIRGLVLNKLGRTEEAEKSIKAGIASDLMNVECWFRYAQFCKLHYKYEDALRAFQRAFALDSNRRDFAMEIVGLSFILSEFETALEMAFKLVEADPSKDSNWMLLIVCHHFVGELDLALDVVETFESNMFQSEANGQYTGWAPTPTKSGVTDPTTIPPIDVSELYQYHVRLLQELGRHEDALALMDERESSIVDKDALAVARVASLMATGSTDAAKALCKELLDTNPENLDYHVEYLKTLGIAYGDDPSKLGETVRGQLLEMYEELSAQHPRCALIHDMQLRFAADDAAFRTKLNTILLKYLRKGTPSLFKRVAAGCTSESRWAVLESLTVDEYLPALRAGTPLGDTEAADPPSTLLWTMYLVAQLYHATGRSQEALAMIDEAIAHSPTVIDLYSLQYHIHKDAGNIEAAVAAAEYSRSLDLADRYLNSQAATALLAADRVEDAMAVVKLFTKDSDQYRSIYDQQALWYMTARARAHTSRGEVGLALKHNDEVMTVFNEYCKVQADLMLYSLRNKVVSGFVDTVFSGLEFQAKPEYHEAVLSSINWYLHLTETERAFSKIDSGSERSAARKAARDARKVARADYAAAHKADAVGRAKVDPDPYGTNLENVADPLGAAVALVPALLKHHPTSLDAHATAVRVYLTPDLASGVSCKPMLALKSALALVALDPNAAQTIDAAWRIFAFADDDAAVAALPAPVAAVLAERVAALPPVKDVAATVQGYTGPLAMTAKLAAAAVKDHGADVGPIAAKLAAAVTAAVKDLAAPVLVTAHAPFLAAVNAAVDMGADNVDAIRAECAKAFPLCHAFAVPSSASS